MKKYAFFLITLLLLASISYAASGPSSSPAPKAKPDDNKTMEKNDSPSQSQAMPEETFKCSELSTRKDRIRCRLNRDEENEYDYLPEECRAVGGIKKADCIKAYKAAQKCWRFNGLNERLKCAREALAIRDIANEMAECKALGNQSACVNALREKVDRYVKFRIYNLEDKAQHLREKGVSEELVVELVTSLEEKKLEYNKASTKEAKKKILADVKELWKNFVAEAKNQVKK